MNEALYPGWGQRFQQVSQLAKVKSEFQDILVFDSVSHGRVLVLDGAIQITEADEFVYQEMLVHVPLLAHGNPRRVLIIGAGDGGVLRRVLQHGTVEHAVMVEIDGEVVRIAREFMPSISGDAWNDPRTTLIIGDGLAYVSSASSASFDVIIVDSTDPVGVGEVLFTEAFYADCARVLDTGGIIVNQAGVPFMQGQELVVSTKRRASAFKHVTAYLVAVPTYVGGFMTLGFASNTGGLDTIPASELVLRSERASVDLKTEYWTPDVHCAAFALPPYIQRYLMASLSNP
ncbi:MAG: polyamine aminopropyltransferase [Janthinobacterium lividum]